MINRLVPILNMGTYYNALPMPMNYLLMCIIDNNSLYKIIFDIL